MKPDSWASWASSSDDLPACRLTAPLAWSPLSVYDNGQLLNPNLVDYPLPRFRYVPLNFSTIILEEGGGPGPYGAKGMGEGGILAVAPAICNAVFNATGVRIQEVPITGERLVRALRSRSGSPLAEQPDNEVADRTQSNKMRDYSKGN